MTTMNASEFRARLAERTLVCDGAMGTMLHAAGNSLDQALPAISLSDPALVRAVHDSYVDAGVDIIQTNTFGASRLRLGEYGLAERIGDINRSAVRIARDAATGRGRPILVAGSVAPAVSVQQRRRIDRPARIDALGEQISALADAGVDLIQLETFGYLDELLEAVEIAIGMVSIPVIAQATFGPDARTLSGHTPWEVVEALADAPVAALGTNCTIGPQRMLAVVRELRAHTDLPLTAQPNAGLPRRTAPARFEYDIDSEYLVRYVRQLLDAGANVVGGCCGTTPTQLAAVVEMVTEHRARATARFAPPPVQQTATSSAVPSFADPGPLVVVELAPEISGDVDDSVGVAAQLAGTGVDLVSVGAGSGMRARISPSDLALNLHQRLGIEVMATVTTWDRTIMALQADLLGAHALGLHRIVCETGSPPLLGDYPHVDGVWDVDAIGLIELLAGLNEGTDFYGLQLPAKTAFEIGTRINPGGRDLAHAAARARDKIAAGAQFLITRPLYDLADLERLLDAIGDDRPPVLAALRPLTGFEDAEYLAHEVPDIHIPDHVLSTLERAGTGAPEAGLDLAAELARAVKPLVNGLVITPTRDPVSTVHRLLRT